MAKQTKIIKTNPERHVVVTPFAVLSFAQLFEARAFKDKPNEAKHFKADFIFENMAALQVKDKRGLSLEQIAKNALVDQWGAKEAKELWAFTKKKLFKDGNENTGSSGETYAGYAGKLYVSAKTGEKFPPFLLLADGKTKAQETDIYGGAIVRAQIAAIPYDFGGVQSISFRLIGVQKVRDGERLGGGEQMESFFDVSESAEDFDNSEASEEDDF